MRRPDPASKKEACAAKKYPGTTRCPLCRKCRECGLIAHDDKPSMHAAPCSRRTHDGRK